MKEFKCSSIGLKDNWKHIARTEDLLLDTVALHLREVHEMKSLSQEMLGKIRNAFTTPTAKDAAAAADLVLQEYNCDHDPACTWRYIAQTEDMIVEGAAAHARDKHGVGKFTHEMAQKVKKNVHPHKEKKNAA
jgi:predicted small metal-binding protein